jgi:hypothetical protein
LTIGEVDKATNFLLNHDYLQEPTPNQKIVSPLLFRRRMLIFTPSTNTPKDVDIRALQLDEKYRREKLQLQQQQGQATDGASQPLQGTFDTINTYCGYWAFNGSQLVFSPQYSDDRCGHLLFGENSIALLLKPRDAYGSEHRIDIAYHTIESVVVEPQSDPCVTFALTYSPKLYELPGIVDHMASMTMAMGGRQQRQLPKTRLDCLTAAHARVVSSCFVYRVRFRLSQDVDAVMRLLRGNRKIMSHVSMPTPFENVTLPFATQFDRLATALQYYSIPFRVKFQVERLATNGYLPPVLVTQLLPHIASLSQVHGPAVVSGGIRRFASSIDFPGPGVDGQKFQVKHLLKSLKERIEQFKMEYSMFDIQSKHQHLVPVHRVSITPTAMFLDGPDLEVSNRVIRQYRTHSDNFIRVEFTDEDGSPLAYDSRTSNERIYGKKYQHALRGSITIAGQIYKFLGFSHSSLRSQTCWFCAPFVQDGTVFLAPIIIGKLGQFAAIRSPAKCAARIGQAFSDTSGAIQIQKENLLPLSDVERNGRVFSDGCGTISLQLLKKVWMGWAASRNFQPTVLQIRFQGLSLHNTSL